MIQLVADEPDKVREYALSSVREADRLNRLANELLDYSRGEIRLDVSVVPMEMLVNQTLDALRERFEKRGVEVVVENGVQTPVLLDSERMLRVLVNICDNARKAMAKGDTLTFRTMIERDELVIEVADTGRGMAPEVVEHIFEPFYSDSPDGGTGLGMVIVKSVVEAHRGTIAVSSQPGEGTTVTIRIPVRG
jgi:signal transduction histidine kinase